MTLTVRTVAVDDPHDLLGRIAAPAPVAWVRKDEGLVGWGEAVRFEMGSGDDRIPKAVEAFTAWCEDLEVVDEVGAFGTGPVAFGAFTFDALSTGSVLIVPQVVLGRRDGRAWMTVVGSADNAMPAQRALPPHSRIRYAGGALAEVRWLEAVAAAVEDITAGQLDKVVLARDVQVWSDTTLDTRVLAWRLASRFPDCFTFICDGLVGATPELLARLQGDQVSSIVLAGSAPRSASPAADDRHGKALLDSHKDRWEHHLAVDSVRGVLADRCAALNVEGPDLLRLANVQHLATRVHGRLEQGEGIGDLVAALHPTAAVCGTPRHAALDRIRRLEHMDRGRYSGPVGWLDAHGNGEFGIALRCAEVNGSRARLFAGAGVVAESLPEAELEETRLKLLAMQSALGDHTA